VQSSQLEANVVVVVDAVVVGTVVVTVVVVGPIAVHFSRVMSLFPQLEYQPSLVFFGYIHLAMHPSQSVASRDTPSLYHPSSGVPMWLQIGSLLTTHAPSRQVLGQTTSFLYRVFFALQ
jgi:hypothetical protein